MRGLAWMLLFSIVCYALLAALLVAMCMQGWFG